jgi:hypothetical protein
MEKKEIITYKPKKSNIIKLEAYFKKIIKNGKQQRVGSNISE